MKMYFRLTPKRFLRTFVVSVALTVVYFVFFNFTSNTSSLSAADVNRNNIEYFQNDMLLTPRTYNSKYLQKWVPAPVVKEVPSLPGELGQPVVLPDSMKEKMTIKFKENEFNLIVSDMISANRSLTDHRNRLCSKIKYPSRLPTTSIVIIFHNEAWSTLIRTLWSILNRSPLGLVKEIILVDDASTKEFLGDKLDKYVSTLPIHVKVLRMGERSGLIKARLRGAENSRGDVITFLDAHCECSEGWLEPLLSSVTENRRLVAIPIIDVIRDDTLEYVIANVKIWGGFDWRLVFRWVNVPQRERDRTGNSVIAPLHTPTMAGGLFSIDKEFFYEIGSYDEGMMIWGSENVEMSFRVWMCGGILAIIPCSRVGHIYRKTTPYTFPGGGVNEVVIHNSNRLANVWLDEWLAFYYTVNPDRRKVAAGDVSNRVELRQKLKCRSFGWYLNNVYPEMDLPKDSLYVGKIQNVQATICLVAYQENKEAVLHNCSHEISNQVFVFTKKGELRNHGNCLDAASRNGSVKVLKCHQLGGNQKWVYNAVEMIFQHNSGSCLQFVNRNEPVVNVKPCDGSKAQKWFLINK